MVTDLLRSRSYVPSVRPAGFSYRIIAAPLERKQPRNRLNGVGFPPGPFLPQVLAFELPEAFPAKTSIWRLTAVDTMLWLFGRKEIPPSARRTEILYRAAKVGAAILVLRFL